MNQVMFLSWRTASELRDLLIPEGVACRNLYKFPASFILACIRTLWFKLKLPYVKIWFDNKIRNQEGVIIVLDAMIHEKIFRHLRENNPKARLILYYANKIAKKTNYIKQAQDFGWEVWTFNQVDADNYQLKLNHGFFSPIYFSRFKSELPDIYDIAFIGRDKGRMDYIQNLKEHPALKGLNWYLYFVADSFYKRYMNTNYNKYISYEKMLKIHARSAAILDIQVEGSKGFILRTIEALYFKKKIITNNSLIAQADFYHPNNIFILDVDDISLLQEFLVKPYHEVDDRIINNYSVESWVNKFIENA